MATIACDQWVASTTVLKLKVSPAARIVPLSPSCHGRGHLPPPGHIFRDHVREIFASRALTGLTRHYRTSRAPVNRKVYAILVLTAPRDRRMTRDSSRRHYSVLLEKQASVRGLIGSERGYDTTV